MFTGPESSCHVVILNVKIPSSHSEVERAPAEVNRKTKNNKYGMNPPWWLDVWKNSSWACQEVISWRISLLSHCWDQEVFFDGILQPVIQIA